MKAMTFSIRIVSVFLATLLLVSCETRKDPYRKLNKVPTVYLSATSSDFSQKKSEEDALLRHGESKVFYFDYEDDYIDQTISVDYAVFSDQEMPQYIKCTLDKDARTITVSDELPLSTLNNKVVKFSVKIYVKDCSGDRGEAVLQVVNCDDRPAVPSIVVRQIKVMEYSISESGTTDPDGDLIVAYEYLIDGTLIADRAGFENLVDKHCFFNPGFAAKEGTYIISTPLSTVKHAFQTTGTHTVYVRAKDSLGLWSKWYSLNVDF